jgi:hypothetical protein
MWISWILHVVSYLANRIGWVEDSNGSTQNIWFINLIHQMGSCRTSGHKLEPSCGLIRTYSFAVLMIWTPNPQDLLPNQMIWYQFTNSIQIGKFKSNQRKNQERIFFIWGHFDLISSHFDYENAPSMKFSILTQISILIVKPTSDR